MIINPSSLKGAKILERAPTLTRARPSRIFCHSSYFSPVDKPECKTATSSPKRRLKRNTICGVKAISGTSIIAFLPLFKTASIVCK